MTRRPDLALCRSVPRPSASARSQTGLLWVTDPQRASLYTLLCVFMVLALGFILRPAQAEEIASAALSGVNVSNTLTDSWQPALVAASNGTAYLAWEDEGRIYYAVGSGTTWPLSQLVEYGESPALALDGNEMPHLVWSDYSTIEGNYEIFYSQWNANSSTWSLPSNISRTSGSSSAPDIAAGPEKLYAVWVDTTSGSNEIYYAVISGTAVIDSGPITYSGGGSAPAVAVDTTGTVHAVWQVRDWETNKFEVLYSQWDGTGWSLAENVSQSPAVDSTGPDIALTSDGQVYVAWREALTTTTGIEGAIYCNVRQGGTWGIPFNISPETGWNAALPALVVDGDDMPHWVWSEDNGTNYRLLYGWSSGTSAAVSVLLQSTLSLQDAALYVWTNNGQRTVHLAWAGQRTADDLAPWDVFYGSFQWRPHYIFLPMVLRNSGP